MAIMKKATPNLQRKENELGNMHFFLIHSLYYETVPIFYTSWYANWTDT